MRKKQGAIKSRGEAGTAGALRRYFRGKPYVVLKDVALNQVLEVERGELTSEEFSYYRSASLDFLICRDDDSQSFELALEFDSELHDTPSQAHKDSIKNRLCIRAALPLLRVSSDNIILRRHTPILDYILNAYFGEKAISELRAMGKVSQEEEYFVQFDETSKIQVRLMQRGLFSPGFPFGVASQADTQNAFWYQVAERLIDRNKTEQSDQKYWGATTEVSIFKGTSTDHRVFHVERTVRVRDLNPKYNVPGIHGWDIAEELSKFLCFYYIDSEWVPE